jgi:hypothetical protein
MNVASVIYALASYRRETSPHDAIHLNLSNQTGGSIVDD